MSKTVEILIAEDDPQIAKLVQFKLNREGYVTTVAKDGQEALDQIGAKEWSLIILDVMMPVYDGWHVLKVLRSSQWGKVPVIMLTAKSYQPKDLSNAAELGATQVLRKPFDPADLATQVKKVLGG